MELKDILAKLMSSQGLTTAALNRNSGISYTTIDSILRGDSLQPRDETLLPLAKSLSVTLEQLKGREPIESFGDWNSPSDRKLSGTIPLLGNATDFIHFWLNGDIPRSDLSHVFRSSYEQGPRTFAISSPDSAVDPFVRQEEIVFVDPDAKVALLPEPRICLINKNGNYSFRTIVQDLDIVVYAPTTDRFSTLKQDECVLVGYLVGKPEVNYSVLTPEERTRGEHISKFM